VKRRCCTWLLLRGIAS